MAQQKINLQDIHDVLIDVAKKAGDMITGATPIVEGAGSKLNSADLVTETDKAVEKMVSTTLLEKYPSYSFMGEETYEPGTKLTSAPTFITDPIDGTTNFVHQYPYVSISLGFAIERKPTVGVVFNPYIGHLYTAIQGKGAFLTTTSTGKRQKLPLKHAEPLTGLDSCLLAVEWGSERTGPNYECKAATFKKLCARKEDGGAMVHSLRSLGSAALNLCAVAAGGIDAYWEGGCWAWDVCAGWVVLEESGGKVVGGNKEEWKPQVDGRRYLAVRGGEGQENLIKEFWDNIVGKLEYKV